MRIVPFLVAAGALAACRSSLSSNHPDSPNGSGDGPPGGGYTIYQVQNDMMAPGTAVTLHGVVVTAIDNFGAKTGNLWVEDPMGGPFSGVLVYKADPNAVALLQPGDIVDVTGAVKAEFALSSDTTGRTDTELEPAAMGGMVSVTKTGTGSVPAPAMVDALAIGQMSDPARSMEWEKWEGVLVTVTNVSALGAPKSFGSTMPPPADNWDFGITGVAKVEGSLADITMSGVQRDTCLASVTGVVDYFFDYLILPRSTAEMMTGGTACPAPENSMALCTDGIDNDGNGFPDCMDDNCIVAYGPGANTCRQVATVTSIDQAADMTPAMPAFPTTGIEIDNAYVTAVAGDNYWITGSPTGAAAADQGMYVYGNGNTIPSGLAAGKKVTLIGTAKAYNNDMMGEALTEFTLLDASVGTGTVVPTPKTGMTAAQLTTDATGHPYVGSLVTITGPLKLTVAETAANHYTGTLTQGTTTFNILGDITKDMDAVNACYSTVTGIWTYDVYNNVYAVEPTGAPTAGGGCP